MSISMSTLYQLDGGKTQTELDLMQDELGIDPQYPGSWNENPINQIVKSDDLWELYQERCGQQNGTSMLRSQIICQQAMWHHGNRGTGPEGDGLPKTLRKLWYAGHKDAIQHISKRLGVWRDGDQMNDTGANGAMCGTYQEFVVDRATVTYLDMFAKDGSRQFEQIPSYQRLPSPLSNIVFCIEKDAAYEDCMRIAKALGARVALSGGGKMSRAGTERMIRECLSHYFETPTPGDSVTEKDPLYVLVISDWDYDGEAVIAPTFVNQMERYIDPDLIKWCRVGIKPGQVEDAGYDVSETAYMVKAHVNSAYSRWCRENGVFVYEDRTYYNLDELWADLPDWQQDEWLDVMLGALEQKEGKRDRKAIEKEYGYIPADYQVLAQYHAPLVALYKHIAPLGYELDAIRRTEYADIIIEGLLTMVDWDTYLEALSQKAWADPQEVIAALQRKVLNTNADYSDLTDHIRELESWFEGKVADLRGTAEDFENHVRRTIEPLVESWKDDPRISEYDSTAERDDMAEHLQRVSAWDHWQPFDQGARNRRLQQIVETEEHSTLQMLYEEEVPFDQVEIGE